MWRMGSELCMRSFAWGGRGGCGRLDGQGEGSIEAVEVWDGLVGVDGYENIGADGVDVVIAEATGRIGDWEGGIMNVWICV